MGPINEKAIDWFNDEVLAKLRPDQDFSIYEGSSKPLMKDGKEVGISVSRENVRLYSTGIEKLYDMFGAIPESTQA